MKVLCLLSLTVLIAHVNGQFPASIPLWPNARIPLDFTPGLSKNTLFALNYVIRYYEERTCVRWLFNDTTIMEPRLLVNSTLWENQYGAGGLGTRQYRGLWLGPDDFRVKGVFHEVMHNLGWGHIPHRYDSPLYYRFKNLSDINRYSPEESNANGIPFDLSTTVTGGADDPIDSRYKHSQRTQQTTFYDILQVNLAYKCFDTCDKGPKPACKNGGVVDVNNCSKCFCPRQYSGALCEERSAGNAAVDCGKTISVTGTVQSLELPVKPKESPFYIGGQEVDHTHCYYRLEAPPCKRIQVTVRDAPNDCADSCENVGLEIYANVDKRYVGYRYCCHKRLNETIISDYNELMLDAYTWTSFEDARKKWNTYTFKIDVIAVD